MRKILMLFCILASTLGAWGQTEDEGAVARPERNLSNVVLPGEGHINVESLLKNIDTKMDISRLSLAECRVLRNAFAARQGYAFMAGDLRSIFMTTSWYENLMYDRFEKEMNAIDSYYQDKPEGFSMSDSEQKAYLQKVVPLKYTKAETDFMKKLNDRIAYLSQRNFAISSGKMVNVDNLINPWQLEKPNQRLMDALGTYGFAIVPNNYEQLFHVYERNDYHDFPSFVTTDLYLQLYHMYFDCLLREVEEKKMYGFIEQFCQQMEAEMLKLCDSKNKPIKNAAIYDATYFAIARSLISGLSIDKTSVGTSPLIPQNYRDMAVEEINRVEHAQNDFSEFLEYREVMFNYSLFRPRGHYTRTDSLSRYFKAMMWLQTVPFAIENDKQMKRAVLMAHVIGENENLKAAYQRISDPITFLMGPPDNISILQVYEQRMRIISPFEKFMKRKNELSMLFNMLETLAHKQTRIRPKFQRTSNTKVNLLPQRYMPDAEVLQEMVDCENERSQREAPKGLDFFAALGNSAAERILINELKEDQRWDAFKTNLEKMKQRMGEIEWDKNVATQWMNALGIMVGTGKGKPMADKMPYFMHSPQWAKKDLNAALASWAELKHDAILYAKQPMAAECGGYGPPAPIIKAYVEPNIGFWTKAVELADATLSVLKKYHFSTEFAEDITTRLKEQAQFLLNISRKELDNKKLTEEEYYQLEVIGATFENITLDLIRRPDQWLQGWSDVQGPDKSLAVVADVYTANGDNVPSEKHSVVYEAVGPGNDIYVVVEIDGYLYLMRGAVFSYREFQRALSAPRMTDEEWQKELKERPKTGIPSWMNEILVPLDDEVKDNEYIFYSSGC